MQGNPNVHRKQRLIELATGAGAAVVGTAIVRTAVTKIKSCSFCMAVTCFATKLVIPDHSTPASGKSSSSCNDIYHHSAYGAKSLHSSLPLLLLSKKKHEQTNMFK